MIIILIITNLCVVLSINNQLLTAIFELEKIGKCKIEIMDNSGAVMETILLDNHNLELNYSKYSAGNYAIKLETEHHTILKSFQIL